MKSLMKHMLLVVGLVAAGSISTVASAQAPATIERIPVETFFKKPQYGSMRLSPDQKFMAAVVPANGRFNLAVIDMEKRGGAMLSNFSTADVTSVFWANNNRLIYTTGDRTGLEVRGDGGLFAIDRDGKNPRILVEPFRGGSGIKYVLRQTSILSRIKGTTEEILVSANDRSQDTQDLYRMNVNTGRKNLITLNSPGDVSRWVLDKDNVPRATISIDIEKKRYWSSYRETEQSPWKVIAQWDEQLNGIILPYAFDPADPNNLYVTSNVGRDTMAFFKYDLKEGKLGPLVFGDDRYDMSSLLLIGSALGEGGELIFGGTPEEPGKLIGVRYIADKSRTVWFDEEAKRVQAMVDSALPGTQNTFNVNQKRALVLASSDVNPGEYFFFDKEKKTLEETGLKVRPDIDPKKMANMQYITWTAPDGMKIGGYLTLPRNFVKGKPVPLVVHPHGGPWAKDNWGFNPEVQFMANRGWAVLQPNFRGSTGYGTKHMKASYKQWGGTMIDDMIAGIEWTIKEGFVDKNQIAAYGASYGGYATLMMMVKRPDLFKWGINYVGVTDMFVHQDTQPAQKFGDFGNLTKIINGDGRADAELFRQQSPTIQVNRFAAPVLHAYGGEDRNVDIANGRAIKAAFERAGKPFEYIFEPDEAHGFRVDKAVFNFYNRFEQFGERMFKGTVSVGPAERVEEKKQ